MQGQRVKLFALTACAIATLFVGGVGAQASQKPAEITFVVFPDPEKPAAALSNAIYSIRDKVNQNAQFVFLVYDPDSPTFIMAAHDANPPIVLGGPLDDTTRQALAISAGATIYGTVKPGMLSRSDVMFSLNSVSNPTATPWMWEGNSVEAAASAISAEVLQLSAAATATAPAAQPAAPTLTDSDTSILDILPPAGTAPAVANPAPAVTPTSPVAPIAVPAVTPASAEAHAPTPAVTPAVTPAAAPATQPAAQTQPSLDSSILDIPPPAGTAPGLANPSPVPVPVPAVAPAPAVSPIPAPAVVHAPAVTPAPVPVVIPSAPDQSVAPSIPSTPDQSVAPSIPSSPATQVAPSLPGSSTIGSSPSQPSAIATGPVARVVIPDFNSAPAVTTAGGLPSSVAPSIASPAPTQSAPSQPAPAVIPGPAVTQSAPAAPVIEPAPANGGTTSTPAYSDSPPPPAPMVKVEVSPGSPALPTRPSAPAPAASVDTDDFALPTTDIHSVMVPPPAPGTSSTGSTQQESMPAAAAPPRTPAQPISQEARNRELAGDSALDSSDYLGAIDSYRSAIDAAPFDVGLRLKLANAYLLAGYGKQAVGEIRRALTFAPNDPDLKAFLDKLQAKGLVAPGDVPMSEVGVTLHPDSMQAWLILGDAYWNSSQPAKALDAYNTAASLNPGRPEPQAHLAKFYAASGDYDKSLGALARAGVMGYPLALDIINSQTGNLLSSMHSARDQFNSQSITRESYYETLQSLDGQARSLAQFVARIQPPPDYRLAYLHRRLATNLIAQVTAAWVSYLETNESRYSDSATQLEQEATAEMAVAAQDEQAVAAKSQQASNTPAPPPPTGGTNPSTAPDPNAVGATSTAP